MDVKQNVPFTTHEDTITSSSKKPTKNSHQYWNRPLLMSILSGRRRPCDTEDCLRYRTCLAKGGSAQGDGAQRRDTWVSRNLGFSGTAAVYLLCLDIALNNDLSLAILIILALPVPIDSSLDQDQHKASWVSTFPLSCKHNCPCCSAYATFMLEKHQD